MEFRGRHVDAVFKLRCVRSEDCDRRKPVVFAEGFDLRNCRSLFVFRLYACLQFVVSRHRHIENLLISFRLIGPLQCRLTRNLATLHALQEGLPLSAKYITNPAPFTLRAVYVRNRVGNVAVKLEVFGTAVFPSGLVRLRVGRKCPLCAVVKSDHPALFHGRDDWNNRQFLALRDCLALRFRFRPESLRRFNANFLNRFCVLAGLPHLFAENGLRLIVFAIFGEVGDLRCFRGVADHQRNFARARHQ